MDLTTKEAEILNNIEICRIGIEKSKLKIKKDEIHLRHPSSDINIETQILYYNQEILKHSKLILEWKEEIERLRKFLSEEVLEFYDQEVLMLHLRA